MEDRTDRAVLCFLLGGLEGSENLVLEKTEGRAIAFLSLKKGVLEFEETIFDFLPAVAKSLLYPTIAVRDLVQLHQNLNPNKERELHKGEILLVETQPLHVRTVFGRVADGFLPKGYEHTTACVLQPDTMASGDVYELFGESPRVINDIPLEFYTLEPHREYVFSSTATSYKMLLKNQTNL